MTEVVTYRDRYFPRDLTLEIVGDFVTIEYSHDGYNVEKAYVPKHTLWLLLLGDYGYPEDL